MNNYIKGYMHKEASAMWAKKYRQMVARGDSKNAMKILQNMFRNKLVGNDTRFKTLRKFPTEVVPRIFYATQDRIASGGKISKGQGEALLRMLRRVKTEYSVPDSPRGNAVLSDILYDISKHTRNKTRTSLLLQEPSTRKKILREAIRLRQQSPLEPYSFETAVRNVVPGVDSGSRKIGLSWGAARGQRNMLKGHPGFANSQLKGGVWAMDSSNSKRLRDSWLKGSHEAKKYIGNKGNPFEYGDRPSLLIAKFNPDTAREIARNMEYYVRTGDIKSGKVFTPKVEIPYNLRIHQNLVNKKGIGGYSRGVHAGRIFPSFTEYGGSDIISPKRLEENFLEARKYFNSILK